MIFQKTIINSLIFLLFCAFKIQAQTINNNASKVDFEISNMLLNSVEGTFTGMTGTIDFQVENLELCQFDVCIDASSVDTGNEGRDNHLRKEDFFDVAKYPSICFQSNNIEKTASAYQTKGKLTMNGVSKELTIPFTFENNQFTGSFEVDRLDYGIGEATGGFMVGKEVGITIYCVINDK